MTTQNKIAVPRLPLWRLEMMREQAERKADRAREAYDTATAELHELLRVIAERRREDRERLMASVDTKAEAAWVAWANPVEMPDFRGFPVHRQLVDDLVPNQDEPGAFVLDEFKASKKEAP